jgi:hypothetical protein
MRVLDIDVTGDRLERWRRWLAPQRQPFFVADPASVGLTGERRREVAPEVRDTFRLWRVSKDLPAVWLSEDEFSALSRSTRALLVREQLEHGRGGVPSVRGWCDLVDGSVLRAQADGHRFVWWPSLIGDDVAARVLTRVVEQDRLRSRHREVPRHVWDRAARLVPGARRLAGTFPDGSGPNCFGTVLGACGVASAEGEWLQPPAFEEWLSQETRAGGDDDAPGTVLLWRDREGGVQHAAVTLGDGWAFEKPSQEWSSPRWVLTVREVISSTRTKGLRLTRHAKLVT